MALSEHLLKIIACPKCKGELEYRKQQRELVCKTCRLIYRIENDIPVMLVEEAQPFQVNKPT